MRAQVIPDTYPVGDINNGPNYIPYGGPADADGDGITDSRWVRIPNMTIKGNDIYTAVRIIDNGAMITVNQPAKFVLDYADCLSQPKIILITLH